MTRVIHYQGFIDYSTVPSYEPALRRHVAAVCRPDTEVKLRSMPTGSFEGTSPAEVARHAYLTYLYTNELVDAALSAQRSGGDAFVLGIIQNPGLREIRSVVDIPATGYGEAAIHLACQLGRRFSIMAFNPDLLDLLEDDVRTYGLSSRAAPLTLIETDYPTVSRGFGDPAPLLAAFEDAAHRALRNGADVLIPGQMILAEILWQNGVRRIEGAPVVDALAACLNAAEMLIEMKRNSGVWQSRRGYWGTKPPDKVIERSRQAFLHPNRLP